MPPDQEKRNPTVKVTIAGRGGVGKTTLCKRAVNEIKQTEFANYKMTIGVQFFLLPKETAKGTINLLVWDLAGQEQFAPVIEGFFGGTQGIILAYDSTSMESYQDLHKIWIPLIKKKCSLEIPIIIISTKNDLENEQIVDPNLVKEFIEDEQANGLNYIDFIEVSAKDDTNVSETFTLLAQKIVELGLYKAKKEK
jgi:small GTP-binding protein